MSLKTLMEKWIKLTTPKRGRLCIARFIDRACPLRGQAITEYVLILFIVVTLSTLIMAMMVSRDPESPGFLVKRWNEIMEFIGKDDPHRVTP